MSAAVPAHISATDRTPAGLPLTEAEVREGPDAVAGLALVQARLTQCTPDEQAAFWVAVQRCFAGGATEEA